MIIVGAGATGLMLACELGLAGVRPLVLERQPQLREAPKANGFSGQIVELLRYRGLLDRVEAASNAPVHPAPMIPFGGMDLNLAPLTDQPAAGPGRSRSRGWSACCTNTPANSAPRYGTDTRWPGSARTTPR